MRSGVVIFPGSNCDRDMIVALRQITGKNPIKIWHKENDIPNLDLIVIPGGFTFGDYLRCGALAARSPVISSVKNHISRGGTVLGVCNGFQILVEAGLVPGVLLRNKYLEFICKKIANKEEVKLEDMIWAEKIAKSYTTARDWLNKARRQAAQDIQEGSMDDFMNKMGLGDPDPSNYKTGFDGADEIVDWFKQDKPEDWRQRD